jgi:hypothetical protein
MGDGFDGDTQCLDGFGELPLLPRSSKADSRNPWPASLPSTGTMPLSPCTFTVETLITSGMLYFLTPRWTLTLWIFSHHQIHVRSSSVPRGRSSHPTAVCKRTAKGAVGHDSN